MSKPKFDKILKLLESGQDFSLTEKQYFQQTGSTLPKSTYYGEPLALCYFTPSDRAHRFLSADTGNTGSY